MRKKHKIIILIILVVCVIAVYAGYHFYRFPDSFLSLSDETLSDEETEALRAEIAAKEDKKILVAYFSYTGNTESVAEALSEETGADLFEISTQQEYTDVYTQSNREIRRGERPALTDTVENMDEYDIIFVGYPVWWHATPTPVNTFLESYDLSGKLVIPFCTSGGSDISETMPTFLDSCENAGVYGERRIVSSGEISAWLDELNLNIVKDIGETADSNMDTDTVSDKNILIAYYSHTGNTENVANQIADMTGGTLAEIQRAEEYDDLQEEAEDEILSGARPEITVSVENVEDYDIIFVGYPIWWDEAPAMIATFLENYDFSGKTIVPFCTSASDTIDNSLHIFSEICPDAHIEEGLTANNDNDIGPWLEALGLLE